MTSATMVQALLKKLASGEYDEVDVRFTDVLGHWRHVTFPAANIDKKIFSNGIGFDGSTLPAMTPTEAGDLAVVPDPRRVFDDQFAKRPTLVMLGDIIHPQSGSPFSRDPRGVARKAQKCITASDFATESLWAPEFEFYLFDVASFWNQPESAGYRFGSIENPSCSGETDRMGLVHPTESAYHMIHPIDSLHDVRAEICANMQRAGIRVRYHHHEVGQMGQMEVEIQLSPFMSAVDSVMITKHVVRSTALKYNLAATFMPRPMAGQPSSGMHYHVVLRKGKEQIFYDEGGYCNLSETALGAVAGVLHHAPALCAFTNSSVNSYRRLVPGGEAPVYRFFSGPNRSAAVRIPAYARDPESIRFEYRVPDGSSNPYLAMSAVLMAAMDGIRNGMNPEKMGYGPVDDNVYSDDFDTSGLQILPKTLDEALDALEEDADFLQESNVFSPDLIEAYIFEKRKEAARFRSSPHPLEHLLYFGL